ncbi:MAG TPA: hypothetical protein VFG86_03270 [Chloroflexota bacterium]|nr:hypothetical protein [Chloroflexota bacterium]
MFEACLTLAQNPNEAQLLAEGLDALARALREWPREAWNQVDASTNDGGLFERLVVSTQPAALDERQRPVALKSAEAVASVLRVMWPETGPLTSGEANLLAASS